MCSVADTNRRFRVRVITLIMEAVSPAEVTVGIYICRENFKDLWYMLKVAFSLKCGGTGFEKGTNTQKHR